MRPGSPSRCMGLWIACLALIGRRVSGTSRDYARSTATSMFIAWSLDGWRVSNVTGSSSFLTARSLRLSWRRLCSPG